MKRFCIVLVLTAMIATPVTGWADVEAVYLAVSGGGNYRGNADVTINGIPAGASKFTTGFNFGTAVGIQLDNRFRFETEISYRENNIDRASGLDAKVSSTALLLNGFYDFDPVGPVRPFIGVGAGLGGVHVDSIAGLSVDEDNTAFAYQGTAGIQWNFHPEWTFSLAYRYLATSDVEVKSPTGGLETKFNSHELVLGLRCLFNL